jgi:anaerobic selenocysteine-containing dehydrogenase
MKMTSEDQQEQAVHSLSRRDFFKRAGAGLMATTLATLVPQGLTAHADSASAPRNIWTQSVFGARVGQDFTADLGAAGKQVLKLTAVNTGISRFQRVPNRVVPAKAGESFCLVFHGKQAAAARQGTYRFEHPQIGRFSIFIVPGGADQGGQSYVAIVNRVNV